MKKTIGKTALTLVAAIVMILLVAVCLAVPAYASVDPAQYATTQQTGMSIVRLLVILALGSPFIVIFMGAVLGADADSIDRVAGALCVGFAAAAGMLLWAIGR